MAAEPSGAWRLNDGAIAWREVQDEIVVLDLNTANYLSINGSGRLLWLALAEGASNADLVKRLMDIYGIPEATAEADVEAFTDSLLAIGLISGC